MTHSLHIDFASKTVPTEEEIDANADVSGEDRDWFAAHPGRKYRLRLMTTVEYKLWPIDDLRPSETAAIFVHQMSPGLRKRFVVIITYSVLDPRWAAFFNGDDAVLEPMFREIEANGRNGERRFSDWIKQKYDEATQPETVSNPIRTCEV